MGQIFTSGDAKTERPLEKSSEEVINKVENRVDRSMKNFNNC